MVQMDRTSPAFATFPEDVSWPPPPQIVRLLARQTAGVVLPPPPVRVTDALVEPRADSPVYRPATSAASSPRASPREAKSSPVYRPALEAKSSPVYRPAPEAKSSPVSRRAPEATSPEAKSVDVGAESVSMSTSMGKTLSRTSLGLASSPQQSFPSSRSRSSPSKSPSRHQHFALREVTTPMQDMSWKVNHDAPWDGHLYLTANAHKEPTAKMCSCATVFSPGEMVCSRCGFRRPVLPPPPVPKMEKAMHTMDPNHADAFERQFAWASVYSDRLYRTQLQKFHDNEDWMTQNGHFHPQLNENSLRIAEALEVPPLVERLPEMLARREEYLELCRKQREDKEVEGVTFQPELHPKSACRTDRNLRSLFKWDNKRVQKMNSLLEAQLDEQAKQCTFVPNIGDKSHGIADGYSKYAKVHDRLVKDAKRRNRELTEEQEILNSMRPRDFEDMWDDLPEPPKPSEKIGPQGFSPKRPLSAPVAKAVASASKKEGGGGREPSRGKSSIRISSVEESKLTERKSVKPSSRASMTLFSGIEAQQAALRKTSPLIGRMSRSSRSGRFSRSRSIASDRMRRGREELDCPKTSTTAGVNTISLKENFKGVAGTLLL